MKTRTLVLAGVSGAFVLGTAAQADFTGVTFAVHIPQGGGKTTYRYFANFDDPTDQTLAVSGNANQILRFFTDTVLVNNGGAFAGLKQEDLPGFPLTGADDSYVTIDRTAFAGNDVNYSPGFLNTDGATAVIVGSSWSDTNDGWFDGDPGSPVTGTNVLIAQFTVADLPDGTPGHLELEGNVDWLDGGVGNPINGAFGPVGNIPVPAPGALALLGLAGLAGRRRRR